MHCAIRLKKSGTMVPRIELVEIGPSMDLVHRRHRLPNEDVRKDAMKSSDVKPRKKVMFMEFLSYRNFLLASIRLSS